MFPKWLAGPDSKDLERRREVVKHGTTRPVPEALRTAPTTDHTSLELSRICA